MTMPFDTNATEISSASVFGEQFWKDPVSLSAKMRAKGAVLPAPFFARGQQKTWMVTRMEEVIQVLKDSQHFTVQLAAAMGNDARRSSQFFASKKIEQHKEGEADEGFALLSGTMLGVDGLDHRRLRSLVSQVFTPKYIQSLRPSIQQIADRLLDRVAAQGCMDLMEDFAYPLPINVICTMLGVPEDNWDVLREGAIALVEGDVAMPDEERESRRASKIRAFQDVIASLVADKRHHPRHDLISQLIQVEESLDRLSEPELLSMIGLLIVAGHETTANLIGNGMLALLDHPDQLAQLIADLSLVPMAVEELLRFAGPNLFTPLPRLVTEDIDLGGQHLSQGDVVIPLLTSANYDESHFAGADELNLRRHSDRHVAFGYGIHSCLGAPLARLEADIALTTLFVRLPKIHLNAPRDSITWYGIRDVRGLTTLPVAF